MAGCENEFGGKNAIGGSKRMTFETMSLIANRGERRASHGCARHQPENDQLLIPAVAARESVTRLVASFCLSLSLRLLT